LKRLAAFAAEPPLLAARRGAGKATAFRALTSAAVAAPSRRRHLRIEGLAASTADKAIATMARHAIPEAVVLGKLGLKRRIVNLAKVRHVVCSVCSQVFLFW
jgi:hypothetical protein